jgi:hypothetical protein
MFFIEIALNFLKMTRVMTTFREISVNYLTGYFAFDVIGTLPELFMNESRTYYALKLARLVHVYRLT